MSVVKRDSDEEYELELKSAVERYKNNQKPNSNNNKKKNEVQVKNKKPNEMKENCEKFISCFRNYENQGAIPKGIYNLIKSNDLLLLEKENWRRRRNDSRSPVTKVRSNSRQSHQSRKPVTKEKSSGWNKNWTKGETGNTKVPVCEKLLESFFYIVPEEPSPDFFLPAGSYYVVSKPIELSITATVLCHPPRSENESQKNNSKRDKRRKKVMEHFVVSSTNVNDMNKNVRNISNATLAKDLISDYNSGTYKVDILDRLKKLKSDLEAEIERFKSALEESTTALDQLKIMEFSLNFKAPRDKEFDKKEIDINENYKETESHEEKSEEVNGPNENRLLSEGGLDVVLSKSSSDKDELTTVEKEEPLPTEVQNPDPLAEEHNARLHEDTINSKILNITSVFPDISESYLRTELEKIGDDLDLINIFINNLIEEQNYPKIHVDPDENERKQLWKNYVTDFNPKKILLELSKNTQNKGAAKSDNDDVDLVLSFLKRRYPTQCQDEMMEDYMSVKNISEVCKRRDALTRPVRLAESGFREEKFNREFLLKVTCLDYEKEIDSYLSEIQKRRELEREEAKLCNAFLRCVNCFDEIVPSETITCLEGHIFCSSCVEEYVKVELGNGSYKINCFSGDCDASFDHKTLEELLPASVLLNISMKQQAEEIIKAKVDGLESCSFCDFAYIPDPNDKIFMCRNPSCMAEICRGCREKSHIPLRCDEIERPKDVEARKKIEEIMTNTLVRHCPNCNKKIVKIDGCNKITCTCGTMFCYLCRKQITTYSHFGVLCPLYSNNNELHYKRVQQAGIQARDELLRRDQEIRFVNDPTEGF